MGRNPSNGWHTFANLAYFPTCRQIWSSSVQLSPLAQAGKQHLRRVDKYERSILAVCGPKFRKFREIVSDYSYVVSNAVQRLSIPCFFPKIFAIKARSRRKKRPEDSFSPNFICLRHRWKNDAGGILYSGLSVREWMSAWVSLFVPTNLWTSYLKNQWREFHPILVTDVSGFIDVLIKFCGQRIKGLLTLQ